VLSRLLPLNLLLQRPKITLHSINTLSSKSPFSQGFPLALDAVSVAACRPGHESTECRQSHFGIVDVAARLQNDLLA